MEIDLTQEYRELECATLWKLDESILLIRFIDGFNLNLEDAIAVRDASFELSEGKKFLTLIDARNIGGSLGKRASEYFAQNEELSARRMAQAIVVNTLALKLIVRFYMKINKPRREAQTFDNVEEALVWLESKKHLLEHS